MTADESPNVPTEASRVAAYAEAIDRLFTVSPEQMRDLVPAVLAVADAEQAELLAEVERLTAMLNDSITTVERANENSDAWELAAKQHEAEVTGLRDRLGRVEALADEWATTPDAYVQHGSVLAQAWAKATDQLRAALAVPVTGDTEDASPAAGDRAPSVLGMAEEIYRREDADSEPFFRDKVTGEPCPRRGNVLCILPYSPDHRHVAAHMWDAGAASPTEQATEGGAK